MYRVTLTGNAALVQDAEHVTSSGIEQSTEQAVTAPVSGNIQEEILAQLKVTNGLLTYIFAFMLLMIVYAVGKAVHKFIDNIIFKNLS